MAVRSRRQRSVAGDYWPGFVDALATLLLVLIFLLSIFVLAQFFLSQALSGRDAALAQLNSRISELSSLLDLEKRKADDMQNNMALLRATLADAETRAEAGAVQTLSLQSQLEKADQSALMAGNQIATLETDIDEERQISAEARAQVALLNDQLAALRLQLASLLETLEASEARDRKNRAVIADMGSRLNAALAQKVQELGQYRSVFFQKLREALGDRNDVEIVGDRFILQSEVLFDSGSATISPAGQRELIKIARVLRDISVTIPPELKWVLRIDGHSDRVPIATAKFPSNWHLSSARAISVVRFLVDQSVPPSRLVAAGFGEHHPLDLGSSTYSLKRNRRIEFKLTER